MMEEVGGATSEYVRILTINQQMQAVPKNKS